MATTDLTDSMFAGNNHEQVFTVLDNAGTAAEDLTGRIVKYALARFDANSQPIKSNPVVDMNTTADPTQVVITTPASGIVTVTLLPADTTTLADAGSTDYYFELEVFDAGDTIPVIVSTGTLTINRNVTNA